MGGSRVWMQSIGKSMRETVDHITFVVSVWTEESDLENMMASDGFMWLDFFGDYSKKEGWGIYEQHFVGQPVSYAAYKKEWVE